MLKNYFCYRAFKWGNDVQLRRVLCKKQYSFLFIDISTNQNRIVSLTL